MSDMIKRELDWDDVIEKDAQDFILLPAGDYPFVIADLERGRHAGSEKLPPCNKAVLYIKVTGAEGTVTIKHNLFLHEVTEGMLSAFFASIGQKKKDERLKMDWNIVPGSAGKLKLGIREYTNDKGEKMQFNEVKKFYKYEGELPEGFVPVGNFKEGEF